MPRLLSSFVVFALALAMPVVALADPPAPAPSTASTESEAVLAARAEFLKGAELVRQERWAEALGAFERASAKKSHAITTFNIAQCERALGQYTRARRALFEALDRDQEAAGGELPDPAREEARAMATELEHLLPRVAVTLQPSDAALAIDGRPLEPGLASAAGDAPAFVAGTAAPGPGTPIHHVRFAVVMNPGTHVITVSRRGYQDVVLNRSFSPGSENTLKLELDRLPATIHVTSSHPDAVVRVNGSDVGNPPVEVSRAAGRYRVTVTRAGFLTYETETTVRSGERVELDAVLREDHPALTQRWWFWTAAGALVIGAATSTYFLTRPEPEPTRPPTSGGGLGWSLKVPQ